MTDPRNSAQVPSSRRAFLAALGSGGLAGAAGCLDLAGGDAETITFGQPAAYSGQWSHLQPGVTRATDLALAEIEAAGGLLDSEVDVHRLDTAGDPEETPTVVEHLIEDEGAPVLLGLFGNEIVANLDQLQDRGVPVVSPWAATPDLDAEGGDGGAPENLDEAGWIWRTVVSDTVHVAGAAAGLLAEGAETLGVLYTETPLPELWVETFVEAFENGGGTLIALTELEPGSETFIPELTAVYDAAPDAVTMSAPPVEGVTLVEDWADVGFGGQPLLDDLLRTEAFFEAVGTAATGTRFATATGTGPAYARFEEGFLDPDFGEEVRNRDLHPWAAAAYDATVLAALAIHRAGEATPEAIQRNLGPVSRPGGTTVETFEDGKAALEDGEEIHYVGAASPADFTPAGNVLGEVRIDEVTVGAALEGDLGAFEEMGRVEAEVVEAVLDEH